MVETPFASFFRVPNLPSSCSAFTRRRSSGIRKGPTEGKGRVFLFGDSSCADDAALSVLKGADGGGGSDCLWLFKAAVRYACEVSTLFRPTRSEVVLAGSGAWKCASGFRVVFARSSFRGEFVLNSCDKLQKKKAKQRKQEKKSKPKMSCCMWHAWFLCLE